MKTCYIGDNVGNSNKNSKNRGSVSFLSPEQVRELDGIFKFLNKKDRDILYLIFISKKKQKEVQQILNRIQSSIGYDVRRIRERLEFICYLHSVYDIFIDFIENRSNKYDVEMIEILTLLFHTTSLTHTSKILNLSQIYVRYRFEKILRNMEKYKHWDIYEIFLAISSNFNIIKRDYKKSS